MKAEAKVNAKITIDKAWYFIIDGRSMALYRDGVKDPVGYFTQIVPMIQRIVQLNALERVQDADGTFTMPEYIDVLIDERQRIEKIFEAVQAR